MTLQNDITVNHKGLILHFVKGSIVKKEGKATYILPPKKEKKEDIFKVVNEGIANNEIVTEK